MLFHRFSKILACKTQDSAYMRLRASGGLRYTGDGCFRSRLPNESLIGSHVGYTGGGYFRWISSRLPNKFLIGSQTGKVRKKSHLEKKCFDARTIRGKLPNGCRSWTNFASLQDSWLDPERHLCNIHRWQRERRCQWLAWVGFFSSSKFINNWSFSSSRSECLTQAAFMGIWWFPLASVPSSSLF